MKNLLNVSQALMDTVNQTENLVGDSERIIHDSVDNIRDLISELTSSCDELKLVVPGEETKNDIEKQAEITENLTKLVTMQLETQIKIIKELSNKDKELIKSKEELSEVKKEMFTDKLTGLSNRGKYEIELDEKIQNCRETGELLSYTILDIDFFKSVNDTHGHLVGDAVLRRFSKHITEFLDDSMQAFRYGGEEFVIIFDGCKKDFFDKLSILKDKVEKDICEIKSTGKRINFTFSAGISQFGKGDTKESLFESADSLLYLAKENGRNKIEYGIENLDEFLVDVPKKDRRKN